MTTQEKINIELANNNSLRERLRVSKKNLNHLAYELLSELIEIDGWETMFQNCYVHFKSYKRPMDFFKACSVDFSDGEITFIKGYSNGEEYTVLTIKPDESLEKQVTDAIGYKMTEEQLKEERIRVKELAELKRLLSKYKDYEEK